MEVWTVWLEWNKPLVAIHYPPHGEKPESKHYIQTGNGEYAIFGELNSRPLFLTQGNANRWRDRIGGRCWVEKVKR